MINNAKRKRSNTLHIKTKQRFIIDDRSRFRLLWDLLIAGLNIINIFFIPLEVAF
jgi:hypothetical protein